MKFHKSSIFFPQNFLTKTPAFFWPFCCQAMISVAELAGTNLEAIGPGFSTKDLGTNIDASTKNLKGKTLIDRAYHLEALRLLLKLGVCFCFFLRQKNKKNKNNQPWKNAKLGGGVLGWCRFSKGGLVFEFTSLGVSSESLISGILDLSFARLGCWLSFKMA